MTEWAIQGIGMEKKAVPAIFKRFHRVQNNTGKQHYRFQASELSLFKSLIELHHGGIICINSKPDAGNRSYHSLQYPDLPYLAKREKIEESTFSC